MQELTVATLQLAVGADWLVSLEVGQRPLCLCAEGIVRKGSKKALL